MIVHDIINDYQLIKEFPGGGMASVFVVKKDGRSYALKTPKSDSPEEYRRRFMREVRLMESIGDDHVLSILDSNLDTVEPYYIMPLCDSSLEDIVGVLDADQRLRACIDFAKGILVIHSHGIRHRDIKPANALLLNGNLKISDLGLGRFVDRDTTTMTATMDAMGTAGYIPPEYYDNPQKFREGTVEGDIYMLGKSIYVICSGGGNPMFVDQKLVDPSIYSIIQKCIEIDPVKRYHDVQDIVSDLQEVQSTVQKLKNAPLSIDEILEKKGMIDFEKYAFINLSSIGNNNELMVSTLRKIGPALLKQIFQKHQADIPNFVEYFLESMNHPLTFIQYSDIDVFTILLKILYEQSHDYNTKAVILQAMIDFAVNYNRFPAMETFGGVLSTMSEEEVKNLSVVLLKNKEKINGMKDYFEKPIPEKVHHLLFA